MKRLIAAAALAALVAAGCGGDDDTTNRSAPVEVEEGRSRPAGKGFLVSVDGYRCIVWETKTDTGYGAGRGSGIACDFRTRTSGEGS